MSEGNIPVPTRTDDQLVPVKARLPIGKSNLLMDLQRKQKNPIFLISLDILHNTNFFGAFTASTNVPSIYIQDLVIDFVKNLGYPEELQFVSNMYVNSLYQPWRSIMSLINQYLTDKTSSSDKPRHPVLKMLWGIVLRSNVDYAELLWEDEHNIHRRPGSPVHVTGDDFLLGNLKFIPKGEKDKVFGKSVLKELIMKTIQNSSYDQQYLEMVARKPTTKEGGHKNTASKADKPKNPKPVKKPAPAKQTKPMTEKSTTPTPSKKASKDKVMKVQKGKRSDRLVDEADEEPLPASEPPVDDDEYNLHRGIQMSLESFQPSVDGVAIREPASGVTRSLPVIEGKGKGIATDEQVTLSLLDLQKPKKKMDDTSVNVVRDTPSPADAKTGADTENSNKERTIELNEGQAGSEPGNTLESRPPPDEDQAGSNPGQRHVALAGLNPEPMHEDFVVIVYPKVHQILKHTTKEHVFLENLPSSSGTLSSMKNLDDAFTFGDQFINDKSLEDESGKAIVDTEVESMITVPIHQAYSSAPPLSTPIIDLTLPKPVSPPAQKPIFTTTTATTATTTTTTTLLPPPPPQQQSTTDTTLAARVSALEQICANFEKKHKLQDKTTQALSSMVFTLENHDLYSKIDNYVNETIKEAIQNALQALVHERFKELSEFEMKEILRDRMFKSGSYISQPKHATLYDALEVSMDRNNREEFIEATVKSYKRRRDDQDPPPPPPKDSDKSKKKGHDSDASASKQPQAQTSLAWKTSDIR
ncbi:hypothetical protein Tco_0523932 [Tanacetum coccineum]